MDRRRPAAPIPSCEHCTDYRTKAVTDNRTVYPYRLNMTILGLYVKGESCVILPSEAPMKPAMKPAVSDGVGQGTAAPPEPPLPAAPYWNNDTDSSLPLMSDMALGQASGDGITSTGYDIFMVPQRDASGKLW